MCDWANESDDELTLPVLTMIPINGPADRDLGLLQFSTVLYYLHETNPDNGLVRDKTDPTAPASIAAIGMALATIPVVVERGILFRDFAVKITRKRLRYLLECPQGPEPDASGYKGFFYHFLNIETGRRAWQCELSTLDSAFLFAGALTVAAYFDRDTPEEAEIRTLANALYRRVDWNWARDGGPTLTHGWRPESGFIRHRYQGYDEGLLLYILGLGSPTHPLPPESYQAYCATYQWKKIYDRELLYSGPLFTHQLSHMWVDFRGIRDEFMREHGSDYFENSRQATFVQQEYAIRNPLNFVGYGEHCWGFLGMRRTRLGEASSERGRTRILRLYRSWRAFRSRRRHHCPVGCRGRAPVCTRNRHSDAAALCGNGSGNDENLRVQAVLQSIICRAGQPERLVGHAISLWNRSRADRADDRKLPDWPALEYHAPLPRDRHRIAAGRISRGLAN